MGKSIFPLTLLGIAVTFGVVGSSRADEENNSVEEHKLIFVPAVRVIARSKLGAVIRGEMKSLSSSAVLIVPDKGRFRNPDGIEYELEKLKFFNILDADLKWTDEEDAEKFLTKVSETPGLPISNIVEFRQAELAKAALNPPLGENSSDLKVMRPADGKPAPPGATVTVVCGNCFKQVTVKSDSGQKCPHCGILWDNSEPDAAEMKPKMQAANSADINPAALAANPGINPAAGQQAQPVVGRQQNVPGGQPVAVPQPVQFQTQPQEVTLENLPLWLKAGIFCACMGICYYAVFVR